ncbi:hypothetical protein RIF29_37274 [Crotalaria pallida]|uniref:Uncharacterized protein n=1 Tax=Crotalaria pallida TaxID=3830 RepID=A0AAN9HV31_CROPI
MVEWFCKVCQILRLKFCSRVVGWQNIMRDLNMTYYLDYFNLLFSNSFLQYSDFGNLFKNGLWLRLWLHCLYFPKITTKQETSAANEVKIETDKQSKIE